MESLLSLSDIVVRLLFATVLGALIGWEREYHRKPAGLRTHTLVALGSCTFMLMSLDMHFDLADGQRASIDPNRVLQGVVGGIGFLGAGSILQARGKVSGLTTAASVWVTGAIGAGAGLGSFALVGIATAIGFVVLTVLQKIEARMPTREDPSDEERE
jgi:putative Mg2+ transporter-C (MgtC) family protein